MKNIITLLFSILFVQSCLAQAHTDTTNDLIKKVENGLITNVVYIEGDATSSIEDRMEHYGVPGVSIAVIHNGEIVWARGYGVMDTKSKSPVTEETLFQASLLSMPVTAIGALRLVEQNKVTLDGNINNYLKSWQLPDNEFTKEKKATLKNLLNGTAGINLHAIAGYHTDESVPTLIQVLNGTPPVKNDPIRINREVESELDISAGAYAIIQQMMIDVQGREFPELMNELVLQPLEMNNSNFNQELSAEQLKIAAMGHLTDGSIVKDTYPVMAANGLWTTASDLAKFVINIQQSLKDYNGKGLSKDMTELMLTPSKYKSIYWPDFKYGLGLSIENIEKDTYFGHHGWSGGFFDLMKAHRDKGYGVVVLANSTVPAFNNEVIRAVALAYDWDNYFPIHKKIAIDPSLADRVTGRYQDTNKVVTVFQENDRLFAKNILYTDAQELVKISDSTYVSRNSSRWMQFRPNTENGTTDLVYINSDDKTVTSSLTKTSAVKKEPLEFLMEDDFEKALQAYKTLLKEDPAHPTVTEGYIDDVGELFFRQNRIEIALNAFKLNTKLYPDSFQVYDSYANYCEQVGKIDLAILNYSKSIELNPQNKRAKEKLEELQKSK